MSAVCETAVECGERQRTAVKLHPATGISTHLRH